MLTPDKLDYNNNYCIEIRMGLRGRRAQAFLKIWVGEEGERVNKNMRQDFWIALPTEICCLHSQIIFYPFEEVFHLI